jgi:hypothetical protein
MDERPHRHCAARRRNEASKLAKLWFEAPLRGTCRKKKKQKICG